MNVHYLLRLQRDTKRHTHTYILTDRPTHTHTNRPTDTHACIHANWPTGIQAHRLTDIQTYTLTGRLVHTQAEWLIDWWSNPTNPQQYCTRRFLVYTLTCTPHTRMTYRSMNLRCNIGDILKWRSGSIHAQIKESLHTVKYFSVMSWNRREVGVHNSVSFATKKMKRYETELDVIVSLTLRQKRKVETGLDVIVSLTLRHHINSWWHHAHTYGASLYVYLRFPNNDKKAIFR